MPRTILYVVILLVALFVVGCGSNQSQAIATQEPETAVEPAKEETPAETAEEKAAREERYARYAREAEERRRLEYPFGVCGTNFRLIKRGEYAPQLEMLGFAVKDRQGQLWLVNMEKETEGVRVTGKGTPIYQVLRLKNPLVTLLGDFVGLPRRCVSRESYRTWPSLKTWLGTSLKKSEYDALIPQIEKALADRNPTPKST